tara:strand:- start:719 stop:991 length:273 start_codon:yes stop_codon:yes gene_type:complete
MYTLIDKIELIDDVMTYTEFAQTNDQSLIEEINLSYDSTLGAWIETNIVGLENGTTLLSEFFDVTPLVHVARTIINNGNDLPVVNNIGEL